MDFTQPDREPSRRRSCQSHDDHLGLLAGLGFIFIGTQFLTANMKQVAGPGFQRLVARAIRHPLRAPLLGVAAGAVIQSSNAVTFIAIGLISAGAATVRSAMPIVTWSYAGSTARLLLASFDIELVVLLGIGLIGIVFLFGYDRDDRFRNLVAAMLGLFLLLYGVQLAVDYSSLARDSETLRAVLAFADRFYFWGFVAGTGLAVVVQGQTVSIIAVALAAAGVVGIDQTFLIVVGANLGSGIMTLMQGANLKGTARQLNLYQFLLKVIGTTILLPLLAFEHNTGVPLVEALVTGFTAEAALQVTLLHWLFQIVSAVTAPAFNGPRFGNERSDVLRRMRHELLVRAPGVGPAERQLMWSAMDDVEQAAWLLRRLTATLAAGPLGDRVRAEGAVV